MIYFYFLTQPQKFFNLIRAGGNFHKKILPVLRLFRYNDQHMTILFLNTKAGSYE